MGNQPIIRWGTCAVCGVRRKCRKTVAGVFQPFVHTHLGGTRCAGWLQPARDVSPEPEDLMIDPGFQAQMDDLISGDKSCCRVARKLGARKCPVCERMLRG